MRATTVLGLGLLSCGVDLTVIEPVPILAPPVVVQPNHPGPGGASSDAGADLASAPEVTVRPVSPLVAVSRCPIEPCFGTGALPRLDALDPYRQRSVVRGDTTSAPGARSSAECASQGPELIYDLDLRAFGAPVRVYVAARADFDASVSIESGPVDDAFLVACNEDHTSGVNAAFLSVLLEPEQYRLVVDGETPTDAGEFELVVELPPRNDRCAAAPPNDRCDQAIPLDPELPVQTVFGTTECSSDQAQPLWECGNTDAREGEVFYALDLSQRPSPVLLFASTGLPPTNHETLLYITRDVGGECAETFACNDVTEATADQTRLWARLEPGRYLLAVEYAGRPGDFGLEVKLDAETCNISNDTCRTAEAIEPKLGAQSLVAWPGCGDDSMATDCAGLRPNPDIFYHLDLRGYERPVRVRASAERATEVFSSLTLMADADGDCGNELWCGNFDLWLEPRSYFLALDGFRDEQGPVTLTVEISQDEPAPPVDCIDARVAGCAAAHDPWCCAGDDDDCLLAFLSCGLRPEAMECLCERDPACCNAPGRSSQCQQLLRECGTFCPDFDPVLFCPG